MISFACSASLRYALVSGILGIGTHLTLRVCEPSDPYISVLAILLEPPAILSALSWLSPSPWTFRAVSVSYSSFIVSLVLSVIVYRLSPFHPLAKYPGPIVHKVTKLWGVYLTWSGQQHLEHKRLHDQYGPFVRTGPNELSIVDATAVPAVLGASGLPKGRYYDARQDPSAPRNLIVLRGEEHAVRRRLWNRGLSSASLKEYEVLLAARVAQLVERLQEQKGPIDVAKWLGFFSFDFMGDMAFGSGFNMLRDGADNGGLCKALEDFMFSAALVSHIPWASPIFKTIPSVARGLQTLRKYGVACATSRIKSGPKVKDLWYHLTDEAGLENEQPAFANVVADGTVAIVAGADTVATAVMCLLFFVLSNPSIQERLQAEVDATYLIRENPLDTSKHSSMPFLSACICETLRLLPPVPTNGSRRVPARSGGKVIAGRFVPENTEVYVPAYSLHRDPRYFSPCPERFWPDRWLAKELKDGFNPNAFIPFSFGPANCAGKNLARTEMMMLASVLMHTFHMRFADGFNPAGWEGQLHDHLVLTRKPLPIVFTTRDNS
ncbi:hypothetical protein HGRIS_010929 [Hohenbuehelia grisea]|uniref:Cytochrome P450 n=1 Tax=Hohenbuehelia grisea TaxID=104357 RepID=A0ABR3IYK4_9AGAR